MVEWSCYHDPLRLRLCFDDLSPRETTPSLVKGSPAVLSLYVCASSLHPMPRRRATLSAFSPSTPPASLLGRGRGGENLRKRRATARFCAPRKCSLFCPVYPCSVACPLLALALALALKCPPPCSLIPVSSISPSFPRRFPNSLLMPRSWRYLRRVEKCSLYVQAMC